MEQLAFFSRQPLALLWKREQLCIASQLPIPAQSSRKMCVVLITRSWIATLGTSHLPVLPFASGIEVVISELPDVGQTVVQVVENVEVALLSAKK